MQLSHINPYIDIVRQHLSALIIETAACPDVVQAYLCSFWVHLDEMTLLLPQPQLPVREIRACLGELWRELQRLEQIIFNEDLPWPLNKLRTALIYVSYIVDELLCRRFEFPAAHVTSRLPNT